MLKVLFSEFVKVEIKGGITEKSIWHKFIKFYGVNVLFSYFVILKIKGGAEENQNFINLLKKFYVVDVFFLTFIDQRRYHWKSK